ncbi:tripeptidyl-peptidase II isoform X1 [Rhodnius prolixus]|uniref:tripeptidyl-peptidase II isoform X1 n=1 Tax=Rhodnius prolixus TaxID=13249 RepID=UPI003D18C42B
MSQLTEEQFPGWALLPKRETGVTSFLNKYPQYDGRGIIIAIFDSGVDPGAAGLQVTSEGKQKVIGRYDCSGAGDVDTSTVVQTKNGTITGISGRTLKIPSSWKNPTGNYHIGIKNAYELYPKPLKERIETERKEKKWDPNHKSASAVANQKLNELNTTLDSSKSGQPITRVQKLAKEDLECQVEVLNTFEKKYADQGPVYDCIVFHDGIMWNVCLDTSECGDLESCNLVGEYEKTYQYVTLTKEDLLNYSINVYNDGNLLEIVSICSSHGTHVASIAAACFPDDPDKNGIAPGAQIVSLSIGDSRLDTMETGTSIVRSMIKVMESIKTDNPIEVINMSYGEHAKWSSTGRLGELMNEVVDKYGVTWVAAAGNLGPGLSTIGTPPDISTNNVIGVGAYVSPEMMIAEYSLRNKAPGLPYTWTARGPTLDGGKGVSICAPGGAITSVPQYMLRSAQLLNGTSMASPHVAGAVAILLSGLKAQGIKHTPYLVRRALENTAAYLPSADYFAQGNGLLQVEKAFDYLTTYNESPDSKVRFNVSCGSCKQKGIYLRNWPHNKIKDCAVHLEPVFADVDNMDIKEKLNFRVSLALTCDAPWVQHPSLLEMTNLNRSVQVRIDPEGLEQGVHATSLKGYDVKCPAKGPLFQVEITLVRPIEFPDGVLRPNITYSQVNFKPGQIRRHYIMVPEKVAYGVVKIRVEDEDRSGNFVIHAIQLKPKQSCKALEFYKMLSCSPKTDMQTSFKVKGGIVLELVIGKYWSEQSESTVEYSLYLQGCPPDGDEFTMHHAEGVKLIDIRSGCQVEEISPSVQLTHMVSVLKPSEAKLIPCGKRDIIPSGRQIYQLALLYNLHLSRGTEVSPKCSMLSDLLYESELESQLWMLYDSNKQLLACGDAYPTKYSTKLEKGDYVIKLQVRHEKRDILEKFMDMPMLIKQKLANNISLDIYGSHSQALVQGKKLNYASIPTGCSFTPIYISPLHNDKNLRNLTLGQYLCGNFTLPKSDIAKKVDTYRFKYVLSDLSKKGTNSSNSSKNTADKTKWEEYEEALRDLKTNWLSKMDNVEDAERLYAELVNRFPEHLASHTGLLQALEAENKRPYPGGEITDSMLETAKRVILIAEEVCKAVDQNALLAHLGIKTDHRVDANTINSKMEKQKNAIVDALAKKGSAMCRLYLNHVSGNGDHVITLEAIDDVWLNLLQYVEPTDIKQAGYFGVWHAVAYEHYGRAIKLALKMFEEKATRELEESILWMCAKLGWQNCAQHYARSTLVRFPPAYRLF